MIVSNRCHSRLRQWLLIAALAAALVGMHHLAADPGSVHSTAHAYTVTSPEGAGASVECDPRGAGPRLASTLGEGVSVLSAATSPSGCSCMTAMLGHPCLAVLATAASLLPVMWVLAAHAPQAAGVGGLSSSRAAALIAGAIPTSAVRLAELGISRR